MPKIGLQITSVELCCKLEASTRHLRLAMFITYPDFFFSPHGLDVSLISLYSSCYARAAHFLISSRKRRNKIVIMNPFEPFTVFIPPLRVDVSGCISSGFEMGAQQVANFVARKNSTSSASKRGKYLTNLVCLVVHYVSVPVNRRRLHHFPGVKQYLIISESQ